MYRKLHRGKAATTTSVMPTAKHLPRARQLVGEGDLAHAYPPRPSPALNHLIRALENSEISPSPPDSSSHADLYTWRDGGDAELSATASVLVFTPDSKISISSTIGGDGRNRSARKRKLKYEPINAEKLNGDDNIDESKSVSSEKKRAVSDDDENFLGEKNMRKMCLNPKESTTEEPRATVALEDFVQKINTALQEQRIDEKKAERLRECLQCGDWVDVAYSLLCVQIPEKRKGEGYYSCRVCQVPKKGHTCKYCHVCSSPEEKFKKDDEHVCMYCPMCFEVGKKNKKLVQVQCEGHVCPHATTLRDS
ncbi:hypothetical protein ACHAXA_000060 [Cyclostephanos tholiformis]|uniref:Uncharacterized protein n=1 Tax=Cyclostephanos tholiformis TaxID=382380 RepID=A0ABD3SRJ1_9STRA